MSMNKLLLQLKREYWEYKFLFVWGAVIGALLPALVAIVIFYYGPQAILDGRLNVHNEGAKIKDFVVPENEQTLAYYHFHKAGAFNFFAQIACSISAVSYFLVYSIIALNYSFGCLFSDRKTREILFWRSLPLSEANNLRGKLMTLCISLPLLISLASLVVWLLIVFSGAIYAGDLGLVWQWLFGPESGSLMWFWLLLLFPLFLLPLTSWALFMSALVKNHPGVLGILLPLAILSVEAWLRFHWEIGIGFHPVLQSYVDAIEAYIVFLDGDNFLSWISVESGLWQLLCKSLVVAVVFIAAALWLRNKRYEI